MLYLFIKIHLHYLDHQHHLYNLILNHLKDSCQLDFFLPPITTKIMYFFNRVKFTIQFVFIMVFIKKFFLLLFKFFDHPVLIHMECCYAFDLKEFMRFVMDFD